MLKYFLNQAVPPEAIVGNWNVDCHKSNIAENNKLTQIEKEVIIILINPGKCLIILPYASKYTVMLCCLNPACHNPHAPDGTKYCPNCHVPLVILRNRYRPVKSLGGGGFGKTYLAEDIDKLDEKCVIKQFAPQVQETAALQKATELFEQEAKRLQQLGEHPQIPTLLAYFQEDSRLYLIQQYKNLAVEVVSAGFTVLNIELNTEKVI